MILRYLFIILLFLPVLHFAQNPQLGSIHFNVNDGLPSSEVHDLLQDKEGYIWIATDNGVSRFNGYTFRNFGPEDGLLDNAIFSLFEDDQDNIWMSAFKGLYIYNRAKDTILTFPYNHIIDKYKISSYSDLVESFFVDKEGTVYNNIYHLGILAIYRDGTHQLLGNRSDDGFLIFRQNRQSLISVIANPIRKIVIPDSMRLFLYEQDGVDTTMRRQVSSRYQINPSHYQTVLTLASDKLFISSNNLFYSFDKNEVKLIVEFPEIILTQKQTKNGSIYIGLSKGQEQGGVNYYPSENALYQNQALNYFSNYSITDVLEDRQNGLWFSTKEDGIFYCPNPAVKIYDQRFGLPGDYVSALTPKNENELFIGFNNGYTYHLDIKKYKLTDLTAKTTEIYDLAYDASTGWLWQGSTQGLHYYKEGRWFSAQKRTVFDSISLNKFDIYAGGKVHGSCPGPYGFATFDAKTGQPLFHVRRIYRLRKRTFCTYQDFSGRQWVGLVNGLYEFKRDSLFRPTQMHPSFRLRVEEITQLADSTFVIGTKGRGVILWEGEEIIQIDRSDGLTANMIERIHIDSAQQIWVGTLNGLNRITISNNKPSIQTYTIADGLPSNEVTDITSRGKYVWIATPKGIAQFPILEQERSFAIQTPIIDKIMVNNRHWIKAQSNKLPYWKSNIQFNFFAIDHTQNGSISYRYRLQNKDAWSYIDNPSVNFASLSPDTYRFEVQAANQKGQWCDSAFFNFTIEHPFWKTYWFLSLILLLVGSIIYLFYRNQVQQIRSKANLNFQVQELRQTALRAQMNPHFIFNCLNSIQRYISENNPAKATHYLAQFAQLIRIILNTSTKSIISLEAEISMLKTYIELEKLRMEYPFEYSIEVAPDIDLFELTLPPLLVQPIIENAILHGLTKLKHTGKLHIQYRLVDQYLHITVRDNGPGLMRPLLSKDSPNSMFHQSLGISIIRKRLLLYNKDNKSAPRLTFRSLAGVEGWGQGTEVVLKVGV